MSKKKCWIMGFLVSSLLMATLLAGCGRENMQPQKSLPEFSELVKSGDYEDLNLTIYYYNPLVFTIAPLSIDDLLNWAEYKVVVRGNRLEAHVELLEQICDATLTPIENKSYVNARIYYVFETRENGKLFDVAMWSGNAGIFVNGIEVEANQVFYDMLIPFLPEDALEESRGWLLQD